MATFTGYGWESQYGLSNLDPIDYSSDIFAGDINLTTKTATQTGGPYTNDATDVLNWYGSDFSYTASGIPQAGTVASITESTNGVLAYKLEGLSVSVPQAKTWFDAGDLEAAYSAVYRGADVIQGSPYVDFLMGYGGNDLIHGGGGSDWIETNHAATAGSDTIYGDNGDDYLFAGAGNDWIDGGEGRDQLVFMGSEGWITPEHFYVVSYNGVTVPIPDAVAQPQVGTDKLVNVETLLFSSAPPTIHPFHALDYVASYEDLMNALGTNDSAGFDHYIYNGRNEGRSTTFNGAEYIASYPDLINAFGADADKGTAHYITTGHVEGRTLTFDGLDYIASYGDLIKAFGADPYAGAEHYIRSGRGEGRVVSFNSLDYIASYDDLMDAFGNNGSAGATHYIQAGREEGRTISFNAAQYLANYDDLRAAFGSNVEAATRHFIENGRFEGRSAAPLLINGTGGDDSLVGSSANETLSGLAGNDTLNGEGGTDTASYATAPGPVTVDLASGVATGAAGVDTLISIENVAGSAFNDRLTGNSGANTLDGGAGNDSLFGGAGGDSFVFDSASGFDVISDFHSGEDHIVLDHRVFPALGAPGPLLAAAFKSTITSAIDGDDRILYDSLTYTLSYDADGSGPLAAVQLAQVVGTNLIVSDFFVI